jgi:hypothetical protein
MDYIGAGGYVADLLQVIVRFDELVFKNTGKPSVLIDVAEYLPESIEDDCMMVGHHSAFIQRKHNGDTLKQKVVPIRPSTGFYRIYTKEVTRLADQVREDGIHTPYRMWLATAVSLVRIRVLSSPLYFSRVRVMSAEHYHHLIHELGIPRIESLRETEAFLIRSKFTPRASDIYLTQTLVLALLQVGHSEESVVKYIIS